MRIALLSAEYPPSRGGVGDYTRQLGLALCEQGHEVMVWTIDAGRWTEIDLPSENRHPFQPARSIPLDWGWRSWRAVIAALDTHPPDLLHIEYQTGAYGMHPAINFLPWRLRNLPNRPRVVVTAHDLLQPYLFPKAGLLRRYVSMRLLHDADTTVVTNEPDFARLETKRRRLVPPPVLIPIGSNIPVAPPSGYTRAAWRAQLGVADNETLVAYFGLMSRTKGIDTLIHALAQLSQTRLVIVGGEAPTPQDQSYRAAVQAQINTLGLSERVIITGQVDQSLVSAHLLAADLAALPFVDGATFRRGSLLAALAHGVPVVTTRMSDQGLGARGQHLAHGENVLLVPPNNAAKLAEMIRRLAGDALLRQTLAAAGQELAAQFSWQHIAEQHTALYQTLLATT